MRCACLLVLAACAPFSLGCAALVAQSGVKPDSLTETRAAEELGPPIVTSQDNGGSSLTFRTRRKIADQGGANRLAMGAAYTFGLSELVWLPCQLYKVTRASIFGQVVTVDYDRMGQVSGVTIDGESVYSKAHPPREGEATDDIKKAMEPTRPPAP